MFFGELFRGRVFTIFPSRWFRIVMNFSGWFFFPELFFRVAFLLIDRDDRVPFSAPGTSSSPTKSGELILRATVPRLGTCRDICPLESDLANLNASEKTLYSLALRSDFFGSFSNGWIVSDFLTLKDLGVPMGTIF